MNKIDRFSGEFSFLSNFYCGPVGVNSYLFKTVEHGFQAFKMTTQHDFLMVANAPTPGIAKREARKRTMRPDWELIKQDVMLQFLRAKFFGNIELARKLMATGNAELIEGNTWGDTYWGVCRGKGENHLGKLLMRVRAEVYEMSTRPIQPMVINNV
jgi:ribA/ribD-fused uncharacterized protein